MQDDRIGLFKNGNSLLEAGKARNFFKVLMYSLLREFLMNYRLAANGNFLVIIGERNCYSVFSLRFQET